MSEREKPHVSQEDKEITFRPSVEKSDTDSVEFSTAPTLVTQGDLQDVIDEWKVKFHQLSEGMCTMQTASEQFGDHMEQLQTDSRHHMEQLQKDNRHYMEQLQKDNRAREGAQERRIQELQQGLARFLAECNPAHLSAARPFDTPCAPVVSTPITPSGISSRHRPNFHLTSPIESATRNTDQEFDRRPTHEDDHGNNRDHHDARDPRNIDPCNTDPRNTDPRNTDSRNRDHHDARDTQPRPPRR